MEKKHYVIRYTMMFGGRGNYAEADHRIEVYATEERIQTFINWVDSDFRKHCFYTLVLEVLERKYFCMKTRGLR